MRRYRRYPYLQLITFFSLGPQVSEGSRHAICVNLSDSGMCIYTPDRLSKGQDLLFNDPLPVNGPKATVRWVKEYRITGGFYKSGIMFSGPSEDGSLRPSTSERATPEAPSPPEVEERSSLIEGLNFAFAAGNYKVASADDFWSDLAEISEREAEQFIALTSEVMLNERMKDDASLRLLRAIALFRKALIIFGRQGEHWDDHALHLVEKSLLDFRAIDELGSSVGRLPQAYLKETRDAAAKALESRRPGRAQEVLGKTKLAYMGNRLYLRNEQHAPSGEEMAIFENVSFHYPAIVRSAEIFYKVRGEPGKRYIDVLLYKEASPRNSAGEANDPLCIICLVEDGTFHLVEDLVAETADAEAPAGRDEKDSGPLQSDMESDVMKNPGDGDGPEVLVDSGEENRPADVPGGVIVSARSRAGKKVRLLLVCALLLLLVTATFFLKSHPPKSLPEPKKEVTPVPHQELMQENGEPSQLLSGSPENLLPSEAEPKSSPEVKGSKARRPPASRGIEERKKRPPKAEAGAGRQLTPGRKTPFPEVNKRSFGPPSRDDL